MSVPACCLAPEVPKDFTGAVNRMDPDLTQGQLEPVANNPFRLEPLLRNHTYPLPAWHNLMDKEVLRTFIAPPLINDKVALPL